MDEHHQKPAVATEEKHPATSPLDQAQGLGGWLRFTGVGLVSTLSSLATLLVTVSQSLGHPIQVSEGYAIQVPPILLYFLIPGDALLLFMQLVVTYHKCRYHISVWRTRRNEQEVERVEKGEQLAAAREQAAINERERKRRRKAQIRQEKTEATAQRAAEKSRGEAPPSPLLESKPANPPPLLISAQTEPKITPRTNPLREQHTAQSQTPSRSTAEHSPPEPTAHAQRPAEESSPGATRRYGSSYRAIHQEHRSPVTALCWSPDGRQLIFACEDGTVWRWEPESYQKATQFGEQPYRIVSLAWSEEVEQHVVAYGLYYEMVHGWAVANTGEAVLRRRYHERNVSVVAVSPDGMLLASGGEDHRVHICSSRGKQHSPPHMSYAGHDGPLRHLAWSPLGDNLASSDDRQSLLVWSQHGGPRNMVTSYLGHAQTGDRVSALAWAPSGKLIATAGEPGYALHLWNLNGEQVAQYQEHRARVCAIAWSPNGRQIASSDADGFVHIWDTQSGVPLSTAKHTRKVTQALWAPETRLVTASEDVIQIWAPEQRD